MSQGYAFLIWLLCVGISAVLIGYFLREQLKPLRTEGFAVYTCPSGTNSFVTDSGETQCCNGDVVDGYCTGNLRCTLSPKSRSGLPTCTDLAASDAAAAGSNQCPIQMPNYFASSTVKGCSASQPTANGYGPSDPNQPQCILYPTQALDQVKLDSCYNVLENAKKAAQLVTLEAQANDPACAAVRTAALSASVTVKAAAKAQSAAAVQEAVAKAAVAKAAAKAVSSGTLEGSGGSCEPEVSQNPTGYVMSGDDISGEIPVLKKIKGGPSGQIDLFISKSSSTYRISAYDPNGTFVFANSFVSNAELSNNDQEVNEFVRESFHKNRLEPRKYLIRKV